MRIRKAIIFIFIIILVFPTNAVFASTSELTATIPMFDIYINGNLIDNVHSDYPLITYKDITYFPMTYDYVNSLDITLNWTAETGIHIDKGGNKNIFNQQFKNSNNTLGSQVQVAKVSFPVTVNRKVIDNDAEEFPVLLYKNITYFPLTWRFAVTEFNWAYEWDNKAGLSISSDEVTYTPQDTNPLPDDGLTEFRGYAWGTSVDEIKASEGTPDYEDDESLGYTGVEVAGNDAYAYYFFNNESLYKGGYAIINNYVDETKHIDDFMALKSLLTEKYGQPHTDDVVWLDDLWKENSADWGIALISGDLQYTARWSVETTDITLSLSGENYSINFLLIYKDVK